jgi:hypothetical protein
MKSRRRCCLSCLSYLAVLTLACTMFHRRNTNGGHWMGSGNKKPDWARAATAPSTTFRSTLSAEGFPAKPFTAFRTPK